MNLGYDRRARPLVPPCSRYSGVACVIMELLMFSNLKNREEIDALSSDGSRTLVAIGLCEELKLVVGHPVLPYRVNETTCVVAMFSHHNYCKVVLY